MNIVIDIDENVFTRLFDNGIEDYEIANDDLSAIARSIRGGTPLPEGHEYIDRNNAITSICQWFTTAERNRQFSFTTNLVKQIVADILCNEPIIIKTEKEGEQE